MIGSCLLTIQINLNFAGTSYRQSRTEYGSRSSWNQFKFSFSSVFHLLALVTRIDQEIGTKDYVMMAGAVKAIDRRSVHQICSGQVVLNLATAIKELVENSLDAGATNIEIKLKEYGSESIEVSDNGSGVEESNFAGLTLKHHTSKLQDFSDLSTVDTFGFRGEALSSLCALSDLSVVTCHKSAAVGTRLTYDHDGSIVKRVPSARQQGTTVMLQNLFSTLPVRHREFLRNVKKEFGKMVQVLQAYCIIACGVKLTCTNQSDKGKKSPVVSTSGTATMRESISNVFGTKQLQSLLEFNQHKPGTELCEEYGLKPQQFEKIPFSISGFVSKCDHGQGRSTGDRQFFFINSRPCDFPKVNKLINEVYHMYNRHQYPFIVLDISLAKDAVDVNVTPDKRKVLVQEEKTLLAILKASLQAMFEPRSSSYDINQKPMSAITPSSTALAAMFGRSPGGGGDLTLTQPGSLDSNGKQRGKLNLGNLKRSFAHANHPDDEQMDKRPKQPKLDSFFLKSPASSKKSSSDECQTQDDTVNDEHADVDRTLSAETSHHEQSPFEGKHEQSSLEMSAEMSSLSANYKQSVIDTNGDKTPCRTDNSVPRTNSEPNNCTITFEYARTGSDADDQNNVQSLESMSNSRLTSSVDSPSVNHESGKFEKPDSESSASGAKAASLEEQCHEESFAVGLASGSTKGDGSQESSIARSDGESGFCESSHGLKDEHGDQQKRIIHRMDDVTPVSDMKRREVTIPVSIASLKRAQDDREAANGKRALAGRAFRAKIAPSDNASAEEELSREISKDMFGEMEILGQFNLGFIIARLGRDLFIIDQHATDEKFNFETLQKDTVLQGQKLIQPLQLELTSVNESILMDNLDIFKKNGFDFIIDEDGMPTQRIKLVSQPTSRNWTFGKDDIDELIFMLSDAPGVLCRPTRVRQMFASRACRKSIMIGTALTKADMKKLVCHMGELDQPWNCPHGRPTMRHLFNLNMIPD